VSSAPPRGVLLGVLLSILAPTLPARAHDARPAYLSIEETTPARYAVLWRVPVLAGTRLPVVLKLPDTIRSVTEPARQELPDSLVERRLIESTTGNLLGARFEFAGLQGTITDVLVRVQLLDGTHSTTLVRGSQPWVEIAARSGPFSVLRAYVAHGVEHILFGFDHLLFVLALVLIVPGRRLLFMTITSFTLAHSLTLGLATLGFVDVPGPPVEAAIALSIVLLACEIVHRDRGRPSLAAERPWLVAFLFGLLHGLGFAGALTGVGLPQGEIPVALFAFNVGVELGQIAFIAAVFACLSLAKRIEIPAPALRRARDLAVYAIGFVSAFWFIERLAAFGA
jgi:hydrogenase/urease accessory protein HupE